MGSERLRRIAENEAAYRDVNEAVAGLGEERMFGIACECGEAVCARIIEVDRAAYEDVRSRADRFIVVPGHEIGDAERVVRTASEYLVVEKMDDDARAIVRDRDPRDGSG